MIGRALRIDIEQYTSRREEKVLFATTRAGALTPEMLGRYLASLHYMLTLTPLHMTRARDRSRALGDEALAAHFQHKLEEEVGHDQWAEADLRTLAEAKQQKLAANVVPSAYALGRYIESIIDEHPALYLAYIAFAEYITVMIGPEWLNLLVERCNVPRNAMTAVDNHIELDREHAEEGFSVMDDLVTDPRLLPRMRDAMAYCASLFDAYCAEAVSDGVAAQESGTQAIAEVSERHVSAA